MYEALASGPIGLEALFTPGLVKNEDKASRMVAKICGILEKRYPDSQE